ncbi:MAG: colanic acid/amylovoran biosynthesis glycosyltransferase [Verrucomicrobiales bacterium]|jgi:colanic acid/amylovoran biosynthesis glycosyltransferase
MSNTSFRKPDLAYVFERFPTFTQTFCVREILELERQGLRPMLFSIRDTRDEPLEDHFPPDLISRVHFLPPEKELVAEVTRMKDADLLPQEVVLTLRHWGKAPDKMRVYEAAYVGVKMREAGVWHAHSHFAGVGARCCWWLKKFYAMQFSFTGHANDIFEDSGCAVSLEKLMAEASMVVTVSDYTAAFLNRKFPAEATKVKRVYNGLDLEPFERAKHVEKARPSMLLSVGRLIEKKGFDDLVRACAMIRELGGADFRCVIVGDGPMEEKLLALIAELEVGDLVQLVGPKSQPEIVDLLGEAQIFVLPCVTEKNGGKDNLPTVIMEAMAAALPCVSTRLAGVPEMVIEGETGLLVDERQPGDFAAAVASLLGDAERCRAMGTAGEQHARQAFAQVVTAGSLKQCFSQVGAFGMVGRLKNWLGKFTKLEVSEYALADQEARKAAGK